MQTAKLFEDGRSQAVRLPKEFRFEGAEVRIRREGDTVIIEAVPDDAAKSDWDWLKDAKPFSDGMVDVVLNGRPGPDESARLRDDER